MKFAGAAKRLDDIDLPRIGALIGVGEDEIHAALDIEASGCGCVDLYEKWGGNETGRFNYICVLNSVRPGPPLPVRAA